MILVYVVTYVHIVTSDFHDIGHEKSMLCSTSVCLCVCNADTCVGVLCVYMHGSSIDSISSTTI